MRVVSTSKLPSLCICSHSEPNVLLDVAPVTIIIRNGIFREEFVTSSAFVCTWHIGLRMRAECVNWNILASVHVLKAGSARYMVTGVRSRCGTAMASFPNGTS